MLSCTVFDYIFKGWSQPQIGVFTLPIGALMQELIQERKEETAKMEELLGKLDLLIQ